MQKTPNNFPSLQPEMTPPIFTEVQSLGIDPSGLGMPQHARTVQFMERIGASVELSTPQQSKEFLNSLDFDGFKKWIGRINGMERGIPKPEREKVGKSVVARGSELLGTNVVEYNPPHQTYREQLLALAFEKAQEVDDPEIAGLALGLAINAIHYFDDGNGRTSRMIYSLLSRGYDGSDEAQEYYSGLLVNIDGREVVDLNPSRSGLDRDIYARLLEDTAEHHGYKNFFVEQMPRYIFNGFPVVFADEWTPDNVAAPEGATAAERSMLYRIMTSEGTSMTSFMAVFSPERAQPFVESLSDDEHIRINGNEFLPTLSSEEIKKWWNANETAIATYVNLLILRAVNPEKNTEIAEYYRPKE